MESFLRSSNKTALETRLTREATADQRQVEGIIVWSNRLSVTFGRGTVHRWPGFTGEGGGDLSWSHCQEKQSPFAVRSGFVNVVVADEVFHGHASRDSLSSSYMAGTPLALLESWFGIEA